MAAVAGRRRAASWSDLPTLLARLPDLVRFAERRLDVTFVGELSPDEARKLARLLRRALPAVQRLEDSLYIGLVRAKSREP